MNDISPDFAQIREQQIVKVQKALGLDRADALIRVDRQYAHRDFKKILGENWKKDIDSKRSEDPTNPNSLSNRLIASHAKTIDIACVPKTGDWNIDKEHGTHYINVARQLIEHFGKKGQLEDLSAVMDLPVRERAEFAFEIGFAIHPVMGLWKGMQVVEEKAKGFAEKAKVGVRMINRIDERIEANFDSELARHAARLGVAAAMTACAIGAYMIFGHAIHAGLALKESPIGKLAIGAGMASYALYKEYAEPPRELMQHLKHKKQYEQIVPLSSKQEVVYQAKLKEIESDPTLNSESRDAQFVAARRNCGSASIKEIENTLEHFYKVTDSREDIGFVQKLGIKWSTKAALKYQSFDDLQKLTEDFGKGLSAKLTVHESMARAFSLREMASPEFKKKVETRGSRLAVNLGKGVISTGAGLALGSVFEGAIADLYIEAGVAGVAGIISQKIPDADIASRLAKLRSKTKGYGPDSSPRQALT